MKLEDRFYDKAKCMNCGKVFYKKKNKGHYRTSKMAGIDVRRHDALNCSKKCSKEYAYNRPYKAKPHRVRIKR